MERKRNSGKKFSSSRGDKNSTGRSDFKKPFKSYDKGEGDSRGPKKYDREKKDDFKPRRKFDSDKKDDFKPRRKFEGGDDKFGGEKKFSRKSDDRDDFKPRRKFDSEGKDDFKPRRKFDSDKKDDFKPRRKFEGGDDKFAGEKKFSRKSDDRGDFKPRRKFDSDKKDDFKPRRKFEGGDDKFGGEKKFSRKSDDRGDFKPRRKFDSEGKDDFKPRRKFDSDKKDDFKPRRKFEGGEDKFGGEKKFSRKSDDRGDFKPRRKFDSESKYGEKKDFGKSKSYGNEDRFKSSAKKKYNPNDDLDEPSFSFDEFKKEKKSYESGKKKYEKLTKSKDKKSFASQREDDGTVRLNKYLSNAGICSRREADQLIESGVIKVNGKVVTELGTRILPTDKVSYGDQTVKTETLQYLLLNKPKDYITTVDDPNKRKTVMELIKGACKERVYPVGRLDRNTTGLLLFTNDGELTLKLTHPKNDIRKVYHVVVDQNVSKEDMEKLRNGLELEDGFIMPDDVEFVGEGHNKKDIGIEIHSGKNRVVRRMFEHLGYKVVKLDRVMFAGLTKKDLPRGKWRFLSQKEVSFLKMG